eukprot:TRINITY_DN14721_c0_g1_i5.p1 TRINITY_DN14721_c0_g1~~TRINITY_DN14721_c0_g1_i5.p1  ORF type:complete len:314 (+),score=38.68 TRINITY_DN14721_c0_g1_i5:977-1918(+)
MDDVRRYYNGYSTATSSNLYNPWSILNYLVDKELKSYWIETGSTDFIANAIWSSPLSVREKMLPLLDRKTILVPFEIDINFKTLNSDRTLWSLLYFSGYLTGEQIGEENLNVYIPNAEVFRELSVMWRRLFEQKGFTVQYKELISALLSGNQEILETHLSMFSAYDVAGTPELWYHGFLLAVLYPLFAEGYVIKSNREAGLGRLDIAIHSPTGKPDIIIELKTRTDPKEKDKVNSNTDLRDDAKKGLQQIIDRDYWRIFNDKPTKKIILCSMVFVKKFVAVYMEEFNRDEYPLKLSSAETTTKEEVIEKLVAV